MKDPISMKIFDDLDLVIIEAGIKHAAERGDTDRWIELRVKRGDDSMAIAADLAVQGDA